MSARPEYLFYRILGNSLPPRHSLRQTLDNLSFILEHEPQLPGCEKRWVLNRIIDPEVEKECIRLITQAGHRFTHFPIDYSGEYATRFLDASGMPRQLNPLIAPNPTTDTRDLLVAAVEWVYRHKNLHAININGARNAALSEGREIATWTLPWDGSCYFAIDAWSAFVEATRNNPGAYHVIVPLARVNDHKLVLDKNFYPTTFAEPQIAFRAESTERFDERLRYGSRNKAELLRILGVPGPWQKWNPAPWEKIDDRISAERDRFVVASWVARLPSGAVAGVERNDITRWVARFDGAGEICDELDRRLVRDHLQSNPLTCYSIADLTADAWRIDSEVSDELRRRAHLAISLPLLSVTQKSFQAPGDDQRDYVSIAPYQHVDEQGIKIRRGGDRPPEAMIGSAEGQVDDRTRLEDFVRRSCSLALAGRLLGERRLLDRAADQLRAWFIDPAMRMNPNIKYAQIALAEPEQSNSSGIVDFRGIWPLLDAIRIVMRADCLTQSEISAINDWFRNFLAYLLEAPHCKTAATKLNNVGTWSDVITCAVAAFVGDASHLASTLSKAPLKLLAQLDENGLPAAELTRANPLHSALFNLQGWIALAWIGRHAGIDLWQYSGIGHRNLAMAARVIAVNRMRFSDYPAAKRTFDKRIAAAFDCIPKDAADYERIAQLTSPGHRPVLDNPDFGMPPFWPALCSRD
jgi:hypothetical protein